MIASIFVAEFDKGECMQLPLEPPLTPWRYKQARNHLMVWGAGRPAPLIKITRGRFDVCVIQSAIAFIYGSSNLQQVCICLQLGYLLAVVAWLI
jgi:hypothetical protein